MSGEKPRSILEIKFSAKTGAEIKREEISRRTSIDDKLRTDEGTTKATKRKQETGRHVKKDSGSPSKRVRAETGVPPGTRGDATRSTGTVNLPQESTGETSQGSQITALRNDLRRAKEDLILNGINREDFQDNLSRIRRGETSLEQHLGSDLQARLQNIISLNEYNPDFENDLRDINSEISNLAVSSTLRESVLKQATKAKNKLDSLRRAYREQEVETLRTNVTDGIAYLEQTTRSPEDRNDKIRAIDKFLEDLAPHPTQFIRERRRLNDIKKDLENYLPPENVNLPPNVDSLKQRISSAIHSKNEEQLKSLKEEISNFHHLPEFQTEWTRLENALKKPDRINLRSELNQIKENLREYKNFSRAKTELNALYSKIGDSPEDIRILDEELNIVDENERNFLANQKAENDLYDFRTSLGTLTRRGFNTDREYQDAINNALQQTTAFYTPSTETKAQLKSIQTELKKQLMEAEKITKARPNPVALDTKLRHINESSLPPEERISRLQALEKEIVPHISEPHYMSLMEDIESKKELYQQEVRNNIFPKTSEYNNELNDIVMHRTSGSSTPQQLQRLNKMIMDLNQYKYTNDQPAKQLLERAEKEYNRLEKLHPSPNQLRNEISALTKKFIGDKISLPIYLHDLNELERKANGHSEIINEIELARAKSQEPKKEVNREFLDQTPYLRELLSNASPASIDTARALLRKYADVDKKLTNPFRDALIEIEKSAILPFQDDHELNFLNSRYYQLQTDALTKKPDGTYLYTKEEILNKLEALSRKVLKKAQKVPPAYELASQLDNFETEIKKLPDDMTEKRELYKDSIQSYIDNKTQVPTEIIDIATPGAAGMELVPYIPYNDEEMPQFPSAIDEFPPFPTPITDPQIEYNPPPLPPNPATSTYPALEYQLQPQPVIPLPYIEPHPQPIPMPSIPAILPPPVNVQVNTDKPTEELTDYSTTEEKDSDYEGGVSDNDDMIEEDELFGVATSNETDAEPMESEDERPKISRFIPRKRRGMYNPLPDETDEELEPARKVTIVEEANPDYQSELDTLPIESEAEHGTPISSEREADLLKTPAPPTYDLVTPEHPDPPVYDITSPSPEHFEYEEFNPLAPAEDYQESPPIEALAHLAPENIREEVKDLIHGVINRVELELTEDAETAGRKLLEMLPASEITGDLLGDIVKATIFEDNENLNRPPEEIQEQPTVGFTEPEPNRNIYRPLYQFVDRQFSDQIIRRSLNSMRDTVREEYQLTTEPTDLGVLNHYVELAPNLLNTLISDNLLNQLATRVKGVSYVPDEEINNSLSRILYNKIMEYIDRTSSEDLTIYHVPSFNYNPDAGPDRIPLIPVIPTPFEENKINEIFKENNKFRIPKPVEPLPKSPRQNELPITLPEITTEDKDASDFIEKLLAGPTNLEETLPPSVERVIYEDDNQRITSHEGNIMNTQSGNIIPVSYVDRSGRTKNGYVWIPEHKKGISNDSLGKTIQPLIMKKPSYNYNDIRYFPDSTLSPRDFQKIRNFYKEIDEKPDQNFYKSYRKFFHSDPTRVTSTALKSGHVPKLVNILKEVIKKPRL